jgi:hypothetical protein
MGEEKVTKKMMINCREATMLSVLREHKGLNIWQRIQLAYHSRMCAVCKTFDDQITSIHALVKKAFNSEEITHTLPEEKKEKMKADFDKIIH